MTPRAGVCRFCGCSEFDACTFTVAFVGPMTCSWTDRTESVCSICAPAAKAEARLLRVLSAGYQYAPASEQAYHRGFVIGWFQLRGNLRRCPYDRPSGKAYLWDRGLLAGDTAGRQYRGACGPLTNRPRRSVLVSHRRRPTRPGRRVARN